jgi:hypothetical protein
MDFKDYHFYSDYRKALADYYDQYQWEWFCSFNLAGHKSVSADSYVKQFARGVGKREHIQVCCMGVKVLIPQLHVHLLVSGLDKYGHTLADKDIKRSERLWEILTRKKGNIQLIKTSGVIGYISFKNTPPDAFEMVMPYGSELLQKKRLFKANPVLAPKKSSWHPYEYENLEVVARMAKKQKDKSHSIDEPEEIIIEPVQPSW